MELDAGTLSLLALAGLVFGGASLAVATAALTGQRRVRAAYRAFSMGSRDDVLTLLQRHIDEVGALRQEVADVRRYGHELRELLRGAVSRVATVRYDAFDDMGGRLSFSTALLDEYGDGVVLTSINGRTDSRVYAKPVVGGESRHNLSEEEIRAVGEAMGKTGRTVADITVRRQPLRPRSRMPRASAS